MKYELRDGAPVLMRLAEVDLARGLDEAPKRGWIVADMKQDWKVIYPFQAH